MKFRKAILRTPLYKIASLNSISVLLKIAIGLITSNVLATFIGASGMALAGNFRNFYTAVESLATLGFQNGIVKYVAESDAQSEKFRRVFATGFFAILFFSLLIGAGLFLFAEYWNETTFGNGFNFAEVFRVAAFALPMYALSVFLLSVINGLGKYRKVIILNIIGNVVGLVISVILIWQWQTFGALLSIAVSPALLFFATLYYVNKEVKPFAGLTLKSADKALLKNLSSYSLMAVVSGIVGPLVILAIRNKLIVVTGLESAGYWEALNRISSYYQMFISTILTVYFLPKLVNSVTNSDTKRVMMSFYKGILPLVAVALTFIYLIREYVIRILFTSEFLPAAELFFWQLLGDFLKAASLILGYQFFAKKLTKAFIITEIFSLSVLYFLSIFLIATIGVKGVVMAHAVTYMIYLIVLLIYFRKIFVSKKA